MGNRQQSKWLHICQQALLPLQDHFSDDSPRRYKIIVTIKSIIY